MSEIKVPSLGESVSEATIAQWLKKEGEAVKADEPVVELETDKVTLEVNAPESGVISKIQVKEGETVNVGTILGQVEQGAAANDSAPSEKTKTAQSDASDNENAVGSKHIEEVKVPSLGESVSEATIAQWLKKEGDSVSKDEPLAELETDKATMEVNSSNSGILKKILVQSGDTVEIETVIAQIEVGSGASQQENNTNDTGTASSRNASRKQDAEIKDGNGKNPGDGHLSPAARKMIEDNDLDYQKIKGSGKDGRVTKEDVIDFMDKTAEAGDIPAPKAISTHPVQDGSVTNTTYDHKADKKEERVKMTKLRQIIARRLKEAQNTAAMLTTFNEIDMSAVMAVRKTYKDGFEKKHGVKLGFMSFFVKAAVNALQDIPAVNAEIDGEEILYKNYYNISVAVSTPHGLVVPVVRNCDDKSMAQIEKDIMDLGAKARDGQLSMSEMTGGTFTITNGGIFGSLLSTPILNPPQTGILGMHKIQQRPVVMQDGSIAARPMMYVALSYDHRLVDGKEAVTFLVKIKEAIEDPQRLLLDL